MAKSASRTSHVLLLLSVGYICPSYPKSTQHSYPTGSLACKTYEMTKIDCSYRDLFGVPLLDQNWITELDLSHNRLMNITGAPFEKLHMLLVLDLGYNEISWMSSTAFKGLQSLILLDLRNNHLVNMPKHIFADLFNLVTLTLFANGFETIPGEALAPLHACEDLVLGNVQRSILEIDLRGFQNLTNLTYLVIRGTQVKSNTNNNFLQPLSNLPLTFFILIWWEKDDSLSINNMFAPLTSISTLLIVYDALPALKSLDSPLRDIKILNAKNSPKFIDNTSLQVLQKWNTSLEILRLDLLELKRIEDRTFEWIPNLLTLDLSGNQIKHLGKETFYGLRYLLMLDLSYNSLSEIPSDALKIFSKYASLQYLNLSSNNFDEMIVQNVFSAISTNITCLNVGFSSKVFIIDNVNWTSSLQNLEDLSLTCSDCSTSSILIDSYMQVSSLQKLQISTFSQVVFAIPLCSLFPNLEVISISYYGYFDNYQFSLYRAAQGCFNLKELDLSGMLQNTHLDIFSNLNITLFSLRTLKLTFNKLTSVKEVFVIRAPKLKHLDLAENFLTTIDDDIAYKYPDLISLNVQDNKLKSLVGLEHLTFLQKLNASGNEVTVVPTWLLSKAINLKTLDLSYNTFHCTCAIKPFKNWILSDNQTWLQPGQYVCTTPANLQGTSITSIDLDCRSKTAFYLSVTIPSALMLFIVIIILFRYRWHIKYKLFLLYRNYRPFPDPDEDFEMLQLQYHAYVAYNENSAIDDAWVMNDLQPNMEEGPEQLRLCIKSRDFTPGHFLLDSIDESIHQSRKTILVLSPNFVRSEWCYQEMQMAQMRLLDDNLDVLVLVLLNEIPENKMTLSLRQILCRKDYLKWPKDRAGQRLFWQRLKEELKAPVHVDRCFQL